jgi:hypothetical protein
MPCGYSWRVPRDLKLNGNEETRQLYSKIEATRQIVVCRH